VVSIEWLDPVMLGGTWMPELISAAGGLPLGVTAGERAPTLDLAALERLEPEVVVAKPCGYPVERTLAACLHPRRFPGHLDRYREAVRRVDADLGVHDWA
jgi:hypothetical protein